MTLNLQNLNADSVDYVDSIDFKTFKIYWIKSKIEGAFPKTLIDIIFKKLI